MNTLTHAEDITITHENSDRITADGEFTAPSEPSPAHTSHRTPMTGWQPMSQDEAEAVWRRLESINADIPEEFRGQTDGFWVVGRHGNQPVAVVLLKDRGFAKAYLRDYEPLFTKLPRISYSAGPYSLHHFLDACSVKVERRMFCSEEGVRQLPERLRRLFLYHATKPNPECRPVASYDVSRQELCVRRAGSIGAKALKTALKTQQPADKVAFADCWARTALALVMGEDADLALLTEQGAAQLQGLRDRNIHRTRNDLVAEALVINERLETDLNTTRKLTEDREEEDRPYLDARRASYEAFANARAQALNGVPRNLRPFSQRLIKGLVLATVAGARLPIGTLSNAIATTLAVRYGQALPFMQDTEVVVVGREVPELCNHHGVVRVSGIHLTWGPDAVVLPHPRIILKADVVIIDPRTIFHEFQHARQHAASEEPITDFQQGAQYQTQVIEWKAKQAEADFVKEFGILY